MAKLGRRILHLGLALMAVGGAALYLVLDNVGTAVGTWHLAGPLLIFGLGMGMIFVPLFDIIMGEIGDREVGSASGLLESIQQAGASLGVAVLGTVFFSVAGPTTGHGVLDPAGSVHAAGVVTLLTLVLTAVSFGLGFLLPRRARAHAAPETPTAGQPAPAPAADLALAAA
jgi:MFS family permease